MEDAGKLLTAVLDWARTDDRVHAVVLTGSRARGDRVDAWSDLDVELIGPGWRELAADPSWRGRFGRELVSLAFDGDPTTRLVVYEHGRKIDFRLAGPERLAGPLDALYQRGYRVLLDKTGVTAALPPATGAAPVPRPPNRAEFEGTLSEFWFEASQVPVYLARGDLWVVKFRDWTMKECLLRMLEWHAATEPAGPPDTWHIGHHLAEWLPPELYRRVGECFGRFDAADSWRALRATTAVFGDVSAVVARRRGFLSGPSLEWAEPERAEPGRRVRELIEELAGDQSG